MVIELAVDPDALRAPERHGGPVHALAPGFTFWRERLQFLVWANTYDARDGDPVWWHGRKAARRLADRGWPRAGRPTCRARRHAAAGSTAGRPTPAPADGRGGPPVDRRGRSVSTGPPRRRPTRTWPRTSWPPSTTPPARPGSSPRPARARPGC